MRTAPAIPVARKTSGTLIGRWPSFVPPSQPRAPLAPASKSPAESQDVTFRLRRSLRWNCHKATTTAPTVPTAAKTPETATIQSVTVGPALKAMSSYRRAQTGYHTCPARRLRIPSSARKAGAPAQPTGRRKRSASPGASELCRNRLCFAVEVSAVVQRGRRSCRGDGERRTRTADTSIFSGGATDPARRANRSKKP